MVGGLPVGPKVKCRELKKTVLFRKLQHILPLFKHRKPTLPIFSLLGPHTGEELASQSCGWEFSRKTTISHPFFDLIKVFPFKL